MTIKWIHLELYGLKSNVLIIISKLRLFEQTNNNKFMTNEHTIIAV